jgi:hypothetical protein
MTIIISCRDAIFLGFVDQTPLNSDNDITHFGFHGYCNNKHIYFQWLLLLNSRKPWQGSKLLLSLVISQKIIPF